MQIEEWYKRKLARKKLTLKGIVHSSVEYKRPFGGSCDYAGLSVIVEPNDGFLFDSHVEWPDEIGNQETPIIDGFLDSILSAGVGAGLLNVKITLKSIKWHFVDTNPRAFYMAAKKSFEDESRFENIYYELS